MVKFGLAKRITRISNNSLVLDPFSEHTLLPQDSSMTKTIVGIDCSWNLVEQSFSKKFAGIRRRLPPLLAGNPVNYAKLNKLTTVEAISAALFILDFKKESLDLLDKFKWGHTFYELNQNLLTEYSKMDSESQVDEILKEYGFLS